MSFYKEYPKRKDRRKPYPKRDSRSVDSRCIGRSGSCVYCQKKRLRKYFISIEKADDQLKEFFEKGIE